MLTSNHYQFKRRKYMRFETPSAWYCKQKEKGWQKWFAWYPIEVEYSELVWLEFVERMITGLNDSSTTSSATYDYRFIEK